MRTLRWTDLSGWVRPLGWASLIANMVLVVTGAVVRLTGSGLGCPTWPRCTDASYTPHGEYGIHGVIEFGNRMLTFALAAVAILTFIAAWQTARRELWRLALLMGLGVPAQAVIGGITVLTDLNPWIVSLHLLCSLAIVCLSVRFLQLVDRGGLPVTATGPVVGLAWTMFVAGWAVLYIGTVVTGSGPHAGDADSPRNGLDPAQMSQLHADAVFLFIGLTIGLLFAVHAWGPGRSARRAVVTLLAIQIGQGAIGFVQYFTDLPVVLVAFHMLGAALTAAAVTWALLSVRHPRELDRPVAPVAVD
ncbi:COX15/CtaA family protein [Nocardioides pantholopis]|uniref:COX15/CtaA family protein n=1 Tax=Nocardioides pantholopis TaxID=2483798 RepID=UPI001F1522D2|nr:COX15/CtaA family protein [Nocardioides pantholopis]